MNASAVMKCLGRKKRLTDGGEEGEVAIRRLRR
jgi:hypothetical protein